MNRTVCTILLVACLGVPATAVEIHVPGGYPTIATGLAAASPGDVIVVAAGIYNEGGLVMTSGVTLRGATGDPSDVVIDAGGVDRVLTGIIAIDDVGVEAVTLRNGQAAGGGGLYLEPIGDVTISDCIFRDNHSTSFGGGVYLNPILTGGDLLIERCRFEDNTSISQGGGAAVWGELTVRECVFLRNATSNSTGGGLDQDDGDLLIADSEFTDNASRLSGGGLRADGGTIRIQHCTFTGNEVATGSGGGASVTNGIVGGSRFEANTAGYHGGGLEASPLLQLAECDFVGNTANSVAGGALVNGGVISSCLFSSNGAGVNAGGLQFHSAVGEAEDCIFENNTALNHGGAFASIIAGGVYTFSRCTFSNDDAPYGPEGWMAIDATVTLICCVADPDGWDEGTLVLDDADCPVAAPEFSFSSLKRMFR